MIIRKEHISIRNSYPHISYKWEWSFVTLLFVFFVSCRIEPPLHLADEINVSGNLGLVELEFEVVWNLDEDWKQSWWYGWDDNDVMLFGPIEYPEPTNFEARFFYLGATLPAVSSDYESIEGTTLYENKFRRYLANGYHDLLIWSNIDSEDGSQVLSIDEQDPRKVTATTSSTRVGFNLPRGAESIYNSPEIFYGGNLDQIYISKNPEDYDYYDEVSETWVKHLEASLYPMVYIYLVQVAIYNNRGRVRGISDDAVIGNLSHGVTINTGYTNNSPISVAYPMRMKADLTARDGRKADIIGGKMHTFGLCDMEPWRPASRAPYTGSRTDLTNRMMLNLNFSNRKDSTFVYDITDQMQHQSHGGVITIEIDMDTVRIPPADSSIGSGFDPIIAPSDTITYEFE